MNYLTIITALLIFSSLGLSHAGESHESQIEGFQAVNSSTGLVLSGESSFAHLMAGDTTAFDFVLTNVSSEVREFDSRIAHSLAKQGLTFIVSPGFGSLNPGESVEVKIVVDSSERARNGSYENTIFFNSAGERVSVALTIKVGSEGASSPLAAPSESAGETVSEESVEDGESSSVATTSTSSELVSGVTGFAGLGFSEEGSVLGLWLLLGLIGAFLLVRFLSELVKRYHYETKRREYELLNEYTEA